MKKVLIGAVIFTLIFSLVSCGGNSLTQLDGGYYLERGNDLYGEEFESVSIMNYHPYKFWALPDYQELVQYGYVGLENEGVVYFVYIVDTSRDADSPYAYYCAEFDGETRELLCEEGEYFSDNSVKNATVEKLLNLMDTVK